MNLLWPNLQCLLFVMYVWKFWNIILIYFEWANFRTFIEYFDPFLFNMDNFCGIWNERYRQHHKVQCLSPAKLAVTATVLLLISKRRRWGKRRRGKRRRLNKEEEQRERSEGNWWKISQWEGNSQPLMTADGVMLRRVLNGGFFGGFAEKRLNYRSREWRPHEWVVFLGSLGK